MAEISGKRKARDMNGSNASDHDEPNIKAKKTNELRRRSSFVRGKLCVIFLPVFETYHVLWLYRQTSTTRTF